MKERKTWTILGQLENTTIYPNSTEERIVATIKRLKIPEYYYNGEPFTVFNNDNFQNKDSDEEICDYIKKIIRKDFKALFQKRPSMNVHLIRV